MSRYAGMVGGLDCSVMMAIMSMEMGAVWIAGWKGGIRVRVVVRVRGISVRSLCRKNWRLYRRDKRVCLAK